MRQLIWEWFKRWGLPILVAIVFGIGSMMGYVYYTVHQNDHKALHDLITVVNYNLQQKRLMLPGVVPTVPAEEPPPAK